MDPWLIFLPRLVSFCSLTSQSFTQETWVGGENWSFGSQEALIKILCLTLSSCVMMGNFLTLSESQLAHI